MTVMYACMPDSYCDHRMGMRWKELDLASRARMLEVCQKYACEGPYALQHAACSKHTLPSAGLCWGSQPAYLPRHLSDLVPSGACLKYWKVKWLKPSIASSSSHH